MGTLAEWLQSRAVLSGRSVLPEMNEPAYRPAVLPVARTRGGGTTLTWPAMVSEPMEHIAAFMDSPSARTVAPLGLDLAGGGMGASMAVRGVPAGAVGAFAGRAEKAAGRDGPLYHATVQEFDRFRPRSYFARDRAYAEDWMRGSEEYGGRIKVVYISPKKRYQADEYETSIIASDPALLDAAETADRVDILRRLESEGYDAVDLPVGGRFGDEVLVLDPDIIETVSANANPFGVAPARPDDYWFHANVDEVM